MWLGDPSTCLLLLHLPAQPAPLSGLSLHLLSLLLDKFILIVLFLQRTAHSVGLVWGNPWSDVTGVKMPHCPQRVNKLTFTFPQRWAGVIRRKKAIKPTFIYKNQDFLKIMITDLFCFVLFFESPKLFDRRNLLLEWIKSWYFSPKPSFLGQRLASFCLMFLLQRFTRSMLKLKKQMEGLYSPSSLHRFKVMFYKLTVDICNLLRKAKQRKTENIFTPCLAWSTRLVNFPHTLHTSSSPLYSNIDWYLFLRVKE